MLPSTLLTGFMFPTEGTPASCRWLGALLPMTYHTEWCGIALLLVTVSVKRFTKTME
jgi:hypothetical protein